MRVTALFGALVAASVSPLVQAVASQAYTWKNVKIGGGGGFVPGIVFNPSAKGIAYARTDIGGAYRLNPVDDSWTPLQDDVDGSRWGDWGVDALATDPIDPKRLYLAVGIYTNSWDPNFASILASTDYGATFTKSVLPFKAGGNMPGRGMGERLAIDPNMNSILYFGARSGNGLWKSTNFGATWSKVSSFTAVGTYIQDPSDASGYSSDIVGLSFVTFDSTSGSKGTATPRIFVGVASKGSDNVFVSENGGSTWTPLAGQDTTYLPHKGVLAPAEKALYLSYSNGAGPYDGTAGKLSRYDIVAKTFKDITPPGENTYGFGGIAIDLQKPGTIMAAALNAWWPDGQIFRSTNSGATWTPIWEFNPYPTLVKHYTYDNSKAPWLGPLNQVVTEPGVLQVGWMMEAMVIDPFDSNHWLYGTGATIYGGHDLAKWDTTRNITIASLANGIEETAILGLLSAPVGPPLLSAVGDIGGFQHLDLNVPPRADFRNPKFTSTSDLDYAGNKPASVVRIGTGAEIGQAALSSDSGATWQPHPGAAAGLSGGKIALSANADTVLWRTASGGIKVSNLVDAFATVPSLPADAAIASDKRTNGVFYGASGAQFYISKDGGKTFTAAGKLGASTAPWEIAVHPTLAGDVWVSTDVGIFHSTDSGTTFVNVGAGFKKAWGIALGAPKVASGYPALYALADLEGLGVFRSDDKGLNWVKINTSKNGFGSMSANVITADYKTYGRVYVGTNGRGIFYGEVAGAAPNPTAFPGSSSGVPATSSVPVTSTRGPATISAPLTSTRPATSASSASKTSSASTPTATAPAWGQCGGSSWQGPVACTAGFTCVVSNPFYSQCIPI